jgi:ankyrin repeat protein
MTQTDSAASGSDPRVDFIGAATWHGSLDRAEAILAAHPEVASCDIHTAAILGDDAAVRRFIAVDPASATATSAPYGIDAIVYLCLSKYLRLDPARTPALLRAATALLDAGADANSGFWTKGQHPEFETALYGAAGVAHHVEMTRLLLQRGADPNDPDTVYHVGETDDNGALHLLVETGRLTAVSLALMLLRKHDWHDYDGAKYLLEHGADPNHEWGKRCSIHQALLRGNHLAFITQLLDHGADPTRQHQGRSAIAIAARQGRADVLALLAERGVPLDLHGVDRLIAALAMDDAAAIQAIAAQEPALVGEVMAMGGTLLATFTGNGNLAGVRALLDFGVDVRAPFTEGDSYFDEAKDSLAIHVAAWRAQHDLVTLLIARGSPVDLPDAKGRTPLALAIKACVDSYWTSRRTTASIAALLDAGASVRGVPYPCGYAEADELLRRHGATA